MKPLSPLLAGACVGLKPPSPLRVRNGRFFGAFFGRRGVIGFSGPLLGACSGVVGFTSPCFCVLCAVFVALLGLMWVRARKSSPCVLTMAKSWRLMARWASIFAEMRLERPRWASIFADQQSWDPAGRVCCAVCLAAGPSTGSANPSMRS